MVLFRGNFTLVIFCWAINTSGQDETVKLVIETIVFEHQTHCIPRIGSGANFIPLCVSSSLDMHKQNRDHISGPDRFSNCYTWYGDDTKGVTFLWLQMRWWGKKWCSQILILHLIVLAAIRSHISTMSRPLYVTPCQVNHYLVRSGINDYFWGHLTQHLPVICLNLD